MRVTIAPGPIRGTVTAIPSKSQLHRLLICAALAAEETFLRVGSTRAEDVVATMDCLSALGAAFQRRAEGLWVKPLNRRKLPEECRLPCGESGSTLRFLLPVVCALGASGDFHLKGRLPERPMAPLDRELIDHGARLERPAPDLLRFGGTLTPGTYRLPGHVSSQYITGLLLALPLLGAATSTLHIEGPLESADYVEMTLEAMAQFDVRPEPTGTGYRIPAGSIYRSSGELTVEGDWSNAAFWLCAGAMPGGAVNLEGLQRESRQGDRAILDCLEAMGAGPSWQGASVSLSEGVRRETVIDAAPIPDLIPPLAAVAAVGEGITRIRNAGRLRLKESDRLTGVAETLNALGARVSEEPEGLVIQGVSNLRGGTVQSFGDHRIAMMAAIASAACTEPVTVEGAQAVRKSYPAFWDHLQNMGKTVREVT